eukprot:SM000024S07742  [mRNA]  locus=s24:158367:161815:- [translate_table: standard]
MAAAGGGVCGGGGGGGGGGGLRCLGARRELAGGAACRQASAAANGPATKAHWLVLRTGHVLLRGGPLRGGRARGDPAAPGSRGGALVVRADAVAQQGVKDGIIWADRVEAERKEAEGTRQDDEQKAKEYSSTMQQAMGDAGSALGPELSYFGGDGAFFFAAALVYRHELGMNYSYLLPDLIVGSCPQKPDDVDHLRDSAGVSTILCLQQEQDLQYFNLDLAAIQARAAERGDIEHVRSGIRDFDPFSLRRELPTAVAKLHRAFQERGGNAYVHCTAGLGRAPAVALAYMTWLRGYDLLEVNADLQLTGHERELVRLQWRQGGSANQVEIAGLDVGWFNKVPLEYDTKLQRWVLERELPFGRYQYKYVVDGNWTYNPNAPLTPADKSGNVNNYIEVVGTSMGSESYAMRKRLMQEDAKLTDKDRELLRRRLDELAASISN